MPYFLKRQNFFARFSGLIAVRYLISLAFAMSVGSLKDYAPTFSVPVGTPLLFLALYSTAYLSSLVAMKRNTVSSRRIWIFSFSLKSDGALYSRTQYKPVGFFWMGYASDFRPQGFSCTPSPPLSLTKEAYFFWAAL